ncbi:MAG: ABC transporter substrate-binding protein [Bacteroidales bacterium]|nr:ABC transporter substrate-binding protein [Bacteroidales bacterium]
MLAADSLRKQGLKVEISVYDVDQQERKVSAVLQKPEMKKMDLIVGPFFKNSFAIAADFARSNKIPIVNPLSSRPDILEDNPFVCKPVPSVESQPGIVARLVERDYRDHKVMLYVANQFQNSEMILKLKEAIENADPAGLRKVTIVDFSADSIQGFKRYAAFGKQNLVIIYADNEVLPAALLSKLTVMKEDYGITVLGLPEWEKFTNLETIYLIALNAILLTDSYIDADEEHTKAFIRSYRERYFDEPMHFAFMGFDAGYFFLKGLADYDGNFMRCLPECRIPLTQNQFYFEKTSSGGYDNLNWNVLQYYDYYLIKKSLY